MQPEVNILEAPHQVPEGAIRTGKPRSTQKEKSKSDGDNREKSGKLGPRAKQFLSRPVSASANVPTSWPQLIPDLTETEPPVVSSSRY